MKASIVLAIASVASAATVQEVVDNLFDKYLPQKATWKEVKACHAKCNKDEACLSACPKYECPFQRISAQCDLFNSSMTAVKECHQACGHNFACHFKCPKATPTSMKELKAVGEAMTCHNQCGHDHACHRNCNCPWKEKQARCEELEAVVTCMKDGGSHTTCPHLDEETKNQLMQEPWSLAKDITNHVVDYLLPQEKEVSHEEVKACHMKCGWDLECHHKCPDSPWKKLKEECNTLNQGSACHHACEQSSSKSPFKKMECHFKCPMSMPSSVKELKGLTDHVLCHTTCGQDKICHSTCPNSNWDEKKAECEKFQEISACHKLCGRDHACHHNCPHGEWHRGHHEGGHWHHGSHEHGKWHHHEDGEQHKGLDTLVQGKNVTLVTFDGAKGTTYSWKAKNDPVMGGQSHSTFGVDGLEAYFKGTCAIVPLLKAPGFCKAGTQHSLFSSAPRFADSSMFIDGALHLEVETTTPEYEGFKVAFGAKNAKRPSGAFHHSSPSFKAGFKVPGKKRTVVQVPFRSFSVDWSDFTGRCDTKDPNSGYQHHCCSAEHPEVCPMAQHLAHITSLELWAEGVAGDFDLKIVSIGAGPLEAQPEEIII